MFPSLWVIELLNFLFTAFSDFVSSYRVHGRAVLHEAVIILFLQWTKIVFIYLLHAYDVLKWLLLGMHQNRLFQTGYEYIYWYS